MAESKTLALSFNPDDDCDPAPVERPYSPLPRMSLDPRTGNLRVFGEETRPVTVPEGAARYQFAMHQGTVENRFAREHRGRNIESTILEPPRVCSLDVVFRYPRLTLLLRRMGRIALGRTRGVRRGRVWSVEVLCHPPITTFS